MTNYFQRNRKAKLFKQWVKESELPSEEVPTDLSSGQSEKATDMPDDIAYETVPYRQIKRVTVDKGVVHLPVRYVAIMVSIIAVLLVALSVVVTILITRS